MQADTKWSGAGGAGMRIGIICAQWPLPGWQGEVLNSALQDSGARLADVWLCPAHSPSNRILLRKLIAEWLFARSCRIRPVASSREPVEARDCHDSATGGQPPVAELYLDFGGCRRCLRQVGVRAPQGVWQLTLGSPLPGLDALAGREPTVEVGLYRVGETGQDRQRIRTATLRVLDYSLRQTVDSMLGVAVRWSRELATGKLPRAVGSAAVRKPLQTVTAWPSLYRLLLVSIYLARTRIVHILRTLFTDEIWHIGVMACPIEGLLDPAQAPEIHWLPEPEPGRMYADPFGFRSNGKPYVVFEDLVFSEGRARISCAPIGDGEFSPRSCIESANHLSYPFSFEYEGHTWCVPESARDGSVTLYRIHREGQDWEEVGRLLDGFPGVDSTLVRYQNRWWMFCGREDDCPNYNLYIFHADALQGPWQGHAANPVKSDIRNSRPGGTPFMKNGILYRPAQDSRYTYGGRVVINQVTELTPVSFAEQEVASMEPDSSSRFPGGLHTLSGLGDLTLVDGKRFFFSWRKLPRTLRMLLGCAGS